MMPQPLQPRSSPVDRASVLPHGSPPLPHLTRCEYNPKDGGGQKCTSTLTALHYENSLDSMTTREVTLSLFCQGVLQHHTIQGAVDGCLVLLFYHSISAAMGWHGEHTRGLPSPCATYRPPCVRRPGRRTPPQPRGRSIASGRPHSGCRCGASAPLSPSGHPSRSWSVSSHLRRATKRASCYPSLATRPLQDVVG